MIFLLLPTIASTALVRRYVIAKLNERLNGTIEIADWSLGWTTGMDLRGIRVRDAENVTVLEIARVRTGLTLFNAMRGNFDFGDTDVDDPNLVHFVVDTQGRNNLQSLVKPVARSSGSAGPKNASTGSSPLRMNLHVHRPRGMMTDARINDSVVIEPTSDVVLKITGPNEPIQNAITLVFRVGSGTPGTIKLNGSVSAGASASADLSNPDTNETIELIAVPLAGVGPLLSLAGQSVTLDGTADGTLAMKAAGARPTSLDGQLTATHFSISGGIVHGQSYRASKLVLTEKVTPAGNAMAMKGGLTADDFVAAASADAKEPAYTEKRLVLTNDVLVDAVAKTASFKSFRLDTVGSDALHLAVSGGVTGLGAEQILDDVKITFGYDWERIHAIVRPMLSAETREDLKDFAISGKGEREFVLSGSYPAGKPFNEAIRTVVASGSLAVEHLKVYGVETEKPFELPVSLADGQLRTVFAGKPTGQEMAAPIAANGGTINLGNLRVDLTGVDPRLSAPQGHRLLVAVKINPVLGDKLGRFINPVFTDAKDEQGVLTVVLDQCDAVALSKAVATANSGNAHITFSIVGLDVVNPFGRLMLGSFVKSVPALGKALNLDSKGGTADTLKGSIESGVITLEHGRTTQNITMQLADAAGARPAGGVAASAANPKTMPLVFAGDVNLVDQRMKINATLPAELAARFVESIPQMGGVGKEIRRALPNGIPFTMTGTTRAPKFDWGDVGVKLAAGMLGGKVPLGDILSQKGGGKNPIGDILSPKPGGKDPVGDILGGLTGKKKDADKKTADPAAAPATRESSSPTTAETPAPRRGRRPRTTAPATTAPIDPQTP